MSSNDGNALLLVDSQNIPRTQTQRKKNWKCVFPGCNDQPKTRYNCFSHVWDLHLRTITGQKGNNPQNIELTTFKDSKQKDLIKNLCSKYMVKLVDKVPPSNKLCIQQDIINDQQRTQYPFSFDMKNTTSSDIGDMLDNQNSNENSFGFSSTSDMPQSYSHNAINSNGNIVDPSSSSNTNNIGSNSSVTNNRDASIEMNNVANEITPQEQLNQLQQLQLYQNTIAQLPVQEKELTPEDFIKIEKVNENLRQLHVLGQIFAENGFLVRSDARAKTDINEIQSALDGVMSLVGVSYYYKNDLNDKKFGFIAQEVQKIYPNLVKTDDQGNLSVDYLGVIPLLVEALKQLSDNTSVLTKNDTISEGDVEYRVNTAIDRLEKLLFEADCKNIEKEDSKFDVWKHKVSHMFGPTPFLVFAALFSTIVTIVIPIVFPYMFFFMCGAIFLSLILWANVFINRHEVMTFLASKKAFFPLRGNGYFKWELRQYLAWYVIFTGFVSLVIMSTIMGFEVTIIVIGYIFNIIMSLVIFYLIKKTSSRFGIPYQYSFIILLLFQAVSIGSIVLCIIYQPFQKGYTITPNSKYVIQLSENVQIDSVRMPSVEWNCFSPEVKTNVSLPPGLSFVISPWQFSNQIPVLSGTPTGTIVDSVVQVSLRCNGLVLLDYPTLTFKSCAQNTDPGLCSVNSCGYCRSTVRSFCGICGNYFNIQCANVSGTSTNC